jgi:hypothetical protein
MAAERMLIEDLMPAYDATRVEHRLLHAEPAQVWTAVLEADFVETVKQSRAVRLLFGVRTGAERILAGIRGEPVSPAKLEPDSMRLADLPQRGEWVLLGERPQREIAFGAAGRFWAGETLWEEIDAADFVSFAEPGRARIACNFTLRPYGARQTLLSYEARTQGTDPASSAAFLRYWRPLSPFIGIVMRAQLRMIATGVG